MNTALQSTLCTLALCSAATAQTLTFEAENGVKVVRWLDMFGSVSVEVITEKPNALIQCVALDTAGQPIASASGFAGAMIFSSLTVADVAEVTCRLT